MQHLEPRKRSSTSYNSYNYIYIFINLPPVLTFNRFEMQHRGFRDVHAAVALVSGQGPAADIAQRRLAWGLCCRIHGVLRGNIGTTMEKNMRKHWCPADVPSNQAIDIGFWSPC